MKKIIFNVTFLMIGLVIFSCKNDKKVSTSQSPENSVESTEEKADLNKTGSVTKVGFADEPTNQLYTNYLRIKAALVNSDNALAMKTATQFDEQLPEEELYKDLKATVHLMSLTKDLEKQRDFFKTLTEETEKMIENATIVEGEIYKQYCPMAFDGEGGYWLSDSKEVRNPYFGDKMLNCGSVEAILN